MTNTKAYGHETQVFTIGHSNHTMDQFVRLLKAAKIDAIADVRSVPFSRQWPQFNRHELKAALRNVEISYVFMGDQLGARPKDRECYQNGTAAYSLIAKMPGFIDGLERIKRGAQEKNIALMCAERDPLDCHRTILVARHLQNQGIAIFHILADGSIESNKNIEKRLLDLTEMRTGDLFSKPISTEEAIANAYEYRGQVIAYKEERGTLKEMVEE